METAEQILEILETKGFENFTKEELKDVCDRVRKAEGDRAFVIYELRLEGLWDQDDETTCKEIRRAPGNRAMTIYFAKRYGWWDQDDETTCRLICESPGTRAWAIYHARPLLWWTLSPAETSLEIMKADDYYITALSRQKPWWVEPQTDPVLLKYY